MKKKGQNDEEYPPKGMHMHLELYKCKNTNFYEDDLGAAINIAGCNPLKYVEHEFSPQGKSACMILSESHLSIHSYPEHGIVFADLFACGDNVEIWGAANYLIMHFQAANYKYNEYKRGKWE